MKQGAEAHLHNFNEFNFIFFRFQSLEDDALQAQLLIQREQLKRHQRNNADIINANQSTSPS